MDTDAIVKAQKAKMGQQVIKLAMNYSANHMNYDHGVLTVFNEAVQKAIDDVIDSYYSTMGIVAKWRRLFLYKQATPVQKIETFVVHMNEYLTLLVNRGKGYCSGPEIQDWTEASNVTEVIKVLEHAVQKGYLQTIAKTQLNGTTASSTSELVFDDIATPEELKQRYRKGGRHPMVYRITQEGLNYVKNTLGVFPS
jgi:hypothetical protein